MEILSIQTYSDILNTRDERYLKFALLLLKSFYEYFFEYSREREFNSLERDWILFVCWKLLRNALLLLVFIEAEIEKLTWNIHEHTTVLVRPKTTHVLLLLLLDAQGCKKCVFSMWRMYSRTFFLCKTNFSSFFKAHAFSNSFLNAKAFMQSYDIFHLCLLSKVSSFGET